MSSSTHQLSSLTTCLIRGDGCRPSSWRNWSRDLFSESQKQSLIRDVLIARTAKRRKLTVVSDNKDFPLIQRYYEFNWVSGKEFFN